MTLAIGNYDAEGRFLDLRASRLFLPDAALDSEARLGQILDIYVPGAGAFNTMFVKTTSSPGVGLAADEQRAAKYSLKVHPTANYVGSVSGFYTEADHDSGAFNVAGMQGLFAQAVQGVAATTVTVLRGARIGYSTRAGTTTLALGLEIFRGLSTDAGTLGTGVGIRINASDTVIPGTADIAIQSLGGENRFVSSVTIGADGSPTAGYVLDVRAGKARFEIGGVLKLDIQATAITIGADGSAPNLVVAANNGVNQGATIIMNGAAANTDWQYDNSAGTLRWVASAAVQASLSAVGDFFVNRHLQITSDLDHNGTNVGFYGTAPTTKRTSGADLTNNVTAGGTTDQIDNFTSLVTYSTDAAAIRNDIYQLAKKLKQINDGLRALGLFT